MDTQTQNEQPTLAESAVQKSNLSSVYSVVSGLLIVGSLVFAGIGWHTVYDDSYNARIVGGDAYNFIIYATRGTALVCIGIVCAILSVTFAVLAHTQRGIEPK